MTMERRERPSPGGMPDSSSFSELIKTLPLLKVYDVVSIQNQHWPWPQPALHLEQTPLIVWGTHDNLPHSQGLPTQGQAGEDSISTVPDEQIEVGHTPQVPDRLAEENRAQYIPDGAQEGAPHPSDAVVTRQPSHDL